MNSLDDTLALTRAFRRRHLLAAGATLVAGAATAQTMRHSSPLGGPLGGDPAAIGGTGGQDGWFDAVPGERMRVRVAGDATGGALTVLESVVAPRSATPLHHHAVEEVFLVQSGSLRLVCDGASEDIHAGSSAVVRRGSHHGFVNVTEAPVGMLAIFAPGGMEAMFLALARTPPEGWAEVAGRFDTVIVGPPVTG